MLHLFVSVLPLLWAALVWRGIPRFLFFFLVLLFGLEHGSLSLDFTVVVVFSFQPPIQFLSIFQITEKVHKALLDIHSPSLRTSHVF